VSNQIDPFIFRSGVLTVNGQSGLDLFNAFVTNIGPAGRSLSYGTGLFIHHGLGHDPDRSFARLPQLP
jgi:hypothetical protein